MGHTLGVSKSLSDGMNSTGFLVLCSLMEKKKKKEEESSQCLHL